MKKEPEFTDEDYKEFEELQAAAKKGTLFEPSMRTRMELFFTTRMAIDNETLGDIYGNQRLGSFEYEGAGLNGYEMFGAHEPEDANVMHQQIADRAKHDAGLMGYSGLGAASLFDEPSIHD